MLWHALPAVLLATVAFASVSAGTYLVNDVRNRERDRLHPRKRHRAVAAGTVSPRMAVMVATGLVGSALAVTAVALPRVAVVLIAYVAVNVAYTWRLRNVPVADVACIATGKALRVVAGCAAATVAISPALVTGAFAGGVFLISGVRAREAAMLEARAVRAVRPTLESYSLKRLTAMRAAAGVMTVACVAWWAIADGGAWPAAASAAAVGIATLLVGRGLRSGSSD